MGSFSIHRVPRALYRLAQRFLTLDVTHLLILEQSSVRPPRPLPEHASLAVLEPSDVRRFAEDPAAQLDPPMACRAATGRDFCVAALWDGSLAAYAWYAIGSIEAEHNRGRTVHSGTALSFPPTMAFLYKALTLPAYRGRGLYRQINLFALQQLSARGVRSILTTTDWSNRPALQSCYGVGFRSLGCIWRVGLAHRVAGFDPPRAAELQIRLGRHAEVLPGRDGQPVT